MQSNSVSIAENLSICHCQLPLNLSLHRLLPVSTQSYLDTIIIFGAYLGPHSISLASQKPPNQLTSFSVQKLIFDQFNLSRHVEIHLAGLQPKKIVSWFSTGQTSGI